ncbi:MAG: prolipoprotein diacylglyceryl transferase [Patescibacteria group bacterium]
MFLHTYLPSSVFFTLGPLSFHWYGLLMAVAVGAGYWLVRRRLKKLNINVNLLEGLIIWLVVGGLIGARLVDVFVFEWWYFKDHLSSVLAIWQGGLSWHGGLIGGGAALYWWCKKNQQPLGQWLDVLAPSLALGQAIGRWGNYFNQELFGLPTSLPWGIPISYQFRPLDYLNQVYFHPVFLYESIGLVLIFVYLWKRRPVLSGSLLAEYLVLSGILRLALEGLRIDEQLLIFGLRTGIWFAVLAIAAGAGLWFYWRRQRE